MSSKPKKTKMTDEEKRQAKEKSKVADAAFKKKVTIINGCVLLAFVIVVVAFVYGSWRSNENANKKFEQEKASARAVALVTNGDASVIDIELNDKNYYDWILELDRTYQADEKSEDYACYDGDTIHLQAMIRKQGFNDETGKENARHEIWLYRYYEPTYAPATKATTEGDSTTEAYKYEINTQLIYDGEIPENGTWVDVVGTVSSDYGFSCIRNATITVMDKPGNEYVD